MSNISLWRCYECNSEWITGTEGNGVVIPRCCPSCNYNGCMVRVDVRDGPKGRLLILAEKEDD